MRNSIHRKLLNLELSRNTLGLYLRKNLKRGSEVTKTGNHIKKQLGSSKEIKLNSTKSRNFDIMFSVVLSCHGRRLKSKRETGD